MGRSRSAHAEGATLIPSVKSFGDFVIAASAVARIRDSRQPAPIIVAGRHLKALAEAIGVAPSVEFIGDSSWLDVPPAFDVRKRGRLAALRSLLELRSRLSKIPGSSMIFDHLGWRERFIGGSRRLHSLPAQPNVYMAYEAIFVTSGHSLRQPCIESSRRPAFAALIPGSRLVHKVLPARVIAQITGVLASHGVQCTTIRLEGEALDLPAGTRVEVLPRRFDALAARLASNDLVISADSLSAHLGEFCGLPTFVATPVPNTYWLPREAHSRGAWATFADLSRLHSWLADVGSVK